MMKKAAIIIASGFEEGEALTIADIIKRAHLQCDLVGFEQEVKGGHEIIVRCDHILNETLLDYDMVILPGGYGGALCLWLGYGAFRDENGGRCPAGGGL